MPDPLSYTLITGAVASIIASITEKKAAEVVASFEARLQRGGSPVNHDLQRAFHRAYLEATLFVCKNFMEEFGVSRELLKKGQSLDQPRKEVALVDVVRQKLYAEIDQLSRIGYVPPDEAEKNKLRLLLVSENMSAAQQLEELKTELKQRVILQVSAWQNNLPYCFILMIQDGWVRNKVQLDWFSSLCLWFAEILKTDERVRTIFQSELLAEHAVSVERLQSEFEAFGKPVRESLERIENDTSYIRDRIDDIFLYMKLQKATPEQLADRDRKMEREQQRLIQEGRHRQTSRRKSVGTLPVERLFVDREAYLNRLAKYAADESIHLILVAGHAGFGKTALAAKFCDGIEKAGYQLCCGEMVLPIRGVVYVSKAEMLSFSADRLFDKLMQILEPEEISRLQPIIRDPQLSISLKAERLLDALRGDPVLLILDNFEVMLEENTITHPDLESFLQTVCAVRHSLKLIITSRYEVRLDDLGVRQNIALNEGLETDHAVEFLRKLGTGVRQIEGAADEQLKSLTEKVYGVPMALRSLASFLKAKRRLSIDALLEDETRFEDFREHDYKTGLRKLIREQYNILPNEARLTLQVLAVFNAPVRPVAVQYLLPKLDAETVLDALAFDYFLAQENQDVFELHPAVQEFGYEQIPVKSESGEESDRFTRTALHTRAADFFAELKKPKSEWKSLPDLQPHLDEIEQRMKAGQYDEAVIVLSAIDSEYLTKFGHYRLIVELHENLQSKIDDPKLKQSVGNMGIAYWNMGQSDRAIQCYEQALKNAREAKNRRNEGASLNSMGLCYSDIGEPARAMEYHKQALGIFREIGYRQGEAAALGNMGLCNSVLGKLARAIEYHELAIGIFRENSCPQEEASHLGNLGNCYSALGEPALAIEYHKQALGIARETGYRRGEAIQLGNLGSRYSVLGELTRAMEYHEQALDIDREIGYRQGEAIRLGNLGVCYSDLGELARAIEYYDQALDIAREIGYRREEASQLGNLGNRYADLGEPARAIEYHDQALGIAREISYRQGEASQLGNLGNRYADLGEPARAIEYYEQSLVIKREIGYRHGEAISLVYSGDALADQHQWEKAIAAYHQAIQIADEIRNPQAQNEARYGLALACLCTGELPEARTAAEQARQYNFAPNLPKVLTLLGITALRQQDSDTAKEAFTAAVREADALLNHSDRNFSALDARALSLCGLALCEQNPGHIRDGAAAFRAAREITDAAGTVARVMRLFDELAKADSERMLMQVRSAL